MSKFNICLVQPKNYIHSMAFLELGELIQYSLIELGHTATLGFNHIEPTHKNIVIGCHLLPPSAIPSLPKSTIILNTEQIYKDDSAWNKNIFSWGQQFELWDYSHKNMEKFNELGITHAKHLRIGYQKELERLNRNTKKEVDILFYGSMNERRHAVLQELTEKGLNVKTLFGIYGKERDEWIEKTRIVLNHHYYASQIFEVVRVSYLITNSVAVVAEVNETTAIEDLYRRSIHPAPYEQLTESCLQLIINSASRAKLQEIASNEIKQYPQKFFTESILE